MPADRYTGTRRRSSTGRNHDETGYTPASKGNLKFMYIIYIEFENIRPSLGWLLIIGTVEVESIYRYVRKFGYWG